MQHSHPSLTCDGRVQCRTGMALALIMLLAACAGNQTARVDVQQDKHQSAQANPQVNPQVNSKINPKARADFISAMQTLKMSEYDRTIRLLKKVIAQSPDNPVPYINLAMVHKRMQNMDLAEESLKSAIKVDPDNPVAHNELALLYRKTGRFIEARQEYENLLAKYPNFLMARKNLGILCDLYIRDYSCAIKNYVIYSDFRPDDAPVKLWIADLKGRLK